MGRASQVHSQEQKPALVDLCSSPRQATNKDYLRLHQNLAEYLRPLSDYKDPICIPNKLLTELARKMARKMSIYPFQGSSEWVRKFKSKNFGCSKVFTTGREVRVIYDIPLKTGIVLRQIYFRDEKKDKDQVKNSSQQSTRRRTRNSSSIQQLDYSYYHNEEDNDNESNVPSSQQSSSSLIRAITTRSTPVRRRTRVGSGLRRVGGRPPKNNNNNNPILRPYGKSWKRLLHSLGLGRKKISLISSLTSTPVKRAELVKRQIVTPEKQPSLDLEVVWESTPRRNLREQSPSCTVLFDSRRDEIDLSTNSNSSSSSKSKGEPFCSDDDDDDYVVVNHFENDLMTISDIPEVTIDDSLPSLSPTWDKEITLNDVITVAAKPSQESSDSSPSSSSGISQMFSDSSHSNGSVDTSPVSGTSGFDEDQDQDLDRNCDLVSEELVKTIDNQLNMNLLLNDSFVSPFFEIPKYVMKSVEEIEAELFEEVNNFLLLRDYAKDIPIQE